MFVRNGQGSRRVQRRLSSAMQNAFIAVAIASGLFAIAPARADVSECYRSYELGRKDEAIRLCRRAAWQDNDVFAQIKLGDIYNAKSEGDKGYRDPVEAAVWYYHAIINLRQAEHFFLPEVKAKVDKRLGDAQEAFKDIFDSLLQDERIDVRNRITYIQACRGPEGYLLLGQLLDTRFSRHAVFLPGQASQNRDVDYVQTPLQSGGGLPEVKGESSTVLGTQYNYLDGPFQGSDIESQLFYKLAELSNHPLAKDYLVRPDSTAPSSDPKSRQAELQARAKADRWLAPFEFYASETRYRGELPSGLVLSDECPTSAARDRALELGKRLIPEFLIRDMLNFLGFERGGGKHELARGIAKFQDFLGEAQTGDLTPVQLVRLIQIGAVRGSAKAQRCLGIMYMKGVGVVVNLARSEKWLLAASEQSDGEAMFALSELYSLGGPGVEKSEDKANRYRQGSAFSGYAPVKSEFLRLLQTAP